MNRSLSAEIRLFVCDVIRDARLVSQIPFHEACHRLGIDYLSLYNYELGTKPVPCHIMAKMFEEYRIPKYFFFKRLTYLSLEQIKNDSF